MSATIERNIMRLEHCPLFEELTGPELAFLTDNMRFSVHGRGEQLRVAYNASGYLYYIVTGKVKLYEIDEEGNIIIKELLNEDAFFGHLTPPADSLNFEYAEAISSRVVVGKVPITVVKDIMRTNPNVSLKISSGIWKRYQDIEKRFRNISCLKDVKARLINFFKDWASNEGRRQGQLLVGRGRGRACRPRR